MSILVTLCIPSFNRCHFLGRAIRSAINQTFARDKYEIIVIDDGSTDRTDIILETFKNDIKIIKNKKNIGLSRSLNKAILKSRGKYFLRLDSDDYVNEEYINYLYTTLNLNKSEFDAVKCDYYKIDSKEVVTKTAEAVEKVKVDATELKTSGQMMMTQVVQAKTQAVVAVQDSDMEALMTTGTATAMRALALKQTVETKKQETMATAQTIFGLLKSVLATRLDFDFSEDDSDITFTIENDGHGGYTVSSDRD